MSESIIQKFDRVLIEDEIWEHRIIVYFNEAVISLS